MTAVTEHMWPEFWRADGRLSGGTYAGIAPKASLLIAKVLDQDGNGSVESVLEGMRWVLSMRKKYPIRVVNISVGAKPNLEQRQKKRLILGAESSMGCRNCSGGVCGK